MIRNQTLGSITRIVMAILDYKAPSDNQIQADLQDEDLNWSILRANKEFLLGVMSGFYMPEAIEKWFLNKVDNEPDMVVMAVVHEAEGEEEPEAVEEDPEAVEEEVEAEVEEDPEAVEEDPEAVVEEGPEAVEEHQINEGVDPETVEIQVDPKELAII